MNTRPSDPGPKPRTAVVIGGGPSGLMAAERLSAHGVAVTVHDRMPSLGRKLLMAGRGGLNLTHSEPFDALAARYGGAEARLRPALEVFSPDALIAWAEGLGQPTFVGSSGRVFPKALKASPLLRAWLGRLAAQGVIFRTRSAWQGWDAGGALVFGGADDTRETVRPDVTVLALGGASWPRLGSNGAWAQVLAGKSVALAPFRPSNCGFDVPWSEMFRTRFAGTPLKAIALTHGRTRIRGEAMIAAYGIEGGGVYALSAPMREAIATRGKAELWLDLAPNLTAAQITERFAATPANQSLANRLRKAISLAPAAIALLREGRASPLPHEPLALATAIKGVKLTLTAPRPLERAISTAGGVAFEGVTADLALATMPGVFLAGEMLDWEAPTGGYLLQACLSTGWFAGEAAAGFVESLAI